MSGHGRFDLAVLQDVMRDADVRDQMRRGLLLDRVAREIVGDKTTPLRVRQGIISAVNTASVPNTCDVTLTGASDTTPGARFFAFYRPRVGDVVFCLQNGPDVLILGDLNPVIADPKQFNDNNTHNTSVQIGAGGAIGSNPASGTFYTSKSGIIVVETGGLLYSNATGVRCNLGYRVYEGASAGGTLKKDISADDAARFEGTNPASMMWRSRVGSLTPNTQHFITTVQWSGNGTQVSSDQRRILVEQVA